MRRFDLGKRSRLNTSAWTAGSSAAKAFVSCSRTGRRAAVSSGISWAGINRSVPVAVVPMYIARMCGRTWHKPMPPSAWSMKLAAAPSPSAAASRSVWVPRSTGGTWKASV